MTTTITHSRDEWAALAADVLARLRTHKPLVQNITNFVAMDISANVLLAAGAAPAMVHAEEESAAFCALSNALVINIGTLSEPFLAGAKAAAIAAHSLGIPWVLDPVGVGATSYRDQATTMLLRHRPSIIRGNASEIMSVAQHAGFTLNTQAVTRGVDSTNSSDEAQSAATWLARHILGVVIATGATDFISDGHNKIQLRHGSPLMTRITALGCALSAFVGACTAVHNNAYEASVAALIIYTVAGDIAAEHATGPGSFRTAFIDALDAISADDFSQRLKL
jgi:hydroxyethylthiazole kinase